jgi:hypothetical protein
LPADPKRKLHVPPEGEAAATEIFERYLRTILVIGGGAVGKSSFCRYLMMLNARLTSLMSGGRAGCDKVRTISFIRMSTM